MNNVLPPTDKPTAITPEVARRAATRACIYAERAEAIAKLLRERIPIEEDHFPGVSASAAFWPASSWNTRSQKVREHTRRVVLAADLSTRCEAAGEIAAAVEHAERALGHALAAATELDPEAAVAAERWAAWADQVEAAQKLLAPDAAQPAAPCADATSTRATLPDDFSGPEERTVIDTVVVDEFELQAGHHG